MEHLPVGRVSFVSASEAGEDGAEGRRAVVHHVALGVGTSPICHGPQPNWPL